MCSSRNLVNLCFVSLFITLGSIPRKFNTMNVDDIELLSLDKIGDVFLSLNNLSSRGGSLFRGFNTVVTGLSGDEQRVAWVSVETASVVVLMVTEGVIPVKQFGFPCLIGLPMG